MKTKRTNKVESGTEVIVAESRNPAIASLLSVVLMPQTVEGADNNGGAIDSRTMLTPQQSIDFRDRFSGLLTEFCDTVDANSGIMAQSLEQARIASAALRTAIGGNGGVRETAPKETAKGVIEMPARARMSKQRRSSNVAVVKPLRPGSKQSAVVDFITQRKKVTPSEIRDWACENETVNPKKEEPQVVARRMSAMLPTLKKKGWITAIENDSGPIYWQPVPRAAGTGQTQRNNTKGKSRRTGRSSDGPKPGSQKAVALEVIATAGSDGISAAGIKEQRKDLKHLNTTLRALVKDGHIRNATGGGRGNKAIYVAVSQDGKDDEGDGDGGSEGDGSAPAGEGRKIHRLTYWKTHPRERLKRSPLRPNKPPGDKKQLPSRPTPLPPPPLVTKEPVGSKEWDSLVVRILTDWNWQLTFEQLVMTVKIEGPFYGFSIGGWGSDRIRIEVMRSVTRLEKEGKLRIGEDKNTLFPTELQTQKTPVKPPVDSQTAVMQTEKAEQSADNRLEIKDDSDWYLAVLEIIERADGSITKSDILDELREDRSADWRLPSGISAEIKKAKVELAIVALAEDKVIAPDDEVEAGNEEDIQWRIA